VRRLIIADAHLGQERGDVEAMQGLLEGAAAAGVGEVVYLGDAFQYLLGMAKFWTRTTRRILEIWDGLRAAGVRIVLVEGNRDFFLDEPELAAHHDGSAVRLDLEAGGRRFRLVHGDRVNQRDLQYRFWRAIAKSWPARAWARTLPRAVAVRIVRGMEARLATTNRRFRYKKPVSALMAEAVAAWSEGVDVLLWGHFHSPWRCDRGGRTALVVPAWLEYRLSVLVEPDGAWRLVENSLTPPAELPKMERCPAVKDS